jgi:hypothetical protein
MPLDQLPQHQRGQTYMIFSHIHPCPVRHLRKATITKGGLISKHIFLSKSKCTISKSFPIHLDYLFWGRDQRWSANNSHVRAQRHQFSKSVGNILQAPSPDPNPFLQKLNTFYGYIFSFLISLLDSPHSPTTISTPPFCVNGAGYNWT